MHPFSKLVITSNNPLWSTLINLAHMLGTGTPDITSLAGSAQGQPSLLDRATTRLKEAAADVKARFAGAGSDVQPRGSVEFAAYVKAEADKWSALIRQRRIQLD